MKQELKPRILPPPGEYAGLVSTKYSCRPRFAARTAQTIFQMPPAQTRLHGQHPNWRAALTQAFAVWGLTCIDPFCLGRTKQFIHFIKRNSFFSQVTGHAEQNVRHRQPTEHKLTRSWTIFCRGVWWTHYKEWCGPSVDSQCFNGIIICHIYSMWQMSWGEKNLDWKEIRSSGMKNCQHWGFTPKEN